MRQKLEQSAMIMESPVILLSEKDNVVVCRRNITTGEQLHIDGETIAAKCDVQLGHKIARCFIPAGAKVFKYGVAIGSATADIRPGDWVHVHNLQSNYVSALTRNSQVSS